MTSHQILHLTINRFFWVCKGLWLVIIVLVYTSLGILLASSLQNVQFWFPQETEQVEFECTQLEEIPQPIHTKDSTKSLSGQARCIKFDRRERFPSRTVTRNV